MAVGIMVIEFLLNLLLRTGQHQCLIAGELEAFPNVFHDSQPVLIIWFVEDPDAICLVFIPTLHLPYAFSPGIQVVSFPDGKETVDRFPCIRFFTVRNDVNARQFATLSVDGVG